MSINHRKVGEHVDLDYNNTHEDIVSTLLVWESANSNSSLTIQKIRSVTLDNKLLKTPTVSKTSNTCHPAFPRQHPSLLMISNTWWGTQVTEVGTRNWLHQMCLMSLLYRQLRGISFIYVVSLTKTYAHTRKKIYNLGLEANWLLNLFLLQVMKILFSTFSGTKKFF